MAMNFTNLGTHMATGVEGIDMTAALDDEAVTALRQALFDALVLCIRGQELTPAGLRHAAQVFGVPLASTGEARRTEVEEVDIISSENAKRDSNGRRMVIGSVWHTDHSFMAAPSALSMLYAVEIPSHGGDTQFTNMYAAYEDLPPAKQRMIDELKVEHRWRSSRNASRTREPTPEELLQRPHVIHPLVRTHPETKRRALYLNTSRMEQVVGMDRKESDKLLDELVAHATQEKFQYRHKWRKGDVTIWDNRCTMHLANGDYPEGERRLMYRTMTEGTVPV